MNNLNEHNNSLVALHMAHAVTEYDRKQSVKPGFNRYALPQYLAAVHQVKDEVNAGATWRKAILSNFCGRLANVVLKAAGQLPATKEELR